jgi:hypothetical protein
MGRDRASSENRQVEWTWTPALIDRPRRAVLGALATLAAMCAAGGFMVGRVIVPDRVPASIEIGTRKVSEAISLPVPASPPPKQEVTAAPIPPPVVILNPGTAAPDPTHVGPSTEDRTTDAKRTRGPNKGPIEQGSTREPLRDYRALRDYMLGQ